MQEADIQVYQYMVIQIFVISRILIYYILERVYCMIRYYKYNYWYCTTVLYCSATIYMSTSATVDYESQNRFPRVHHATFAYSYFLHW